MFKNKHLMQLRKTQFLIKHYKECIEKLKSPVPDQDLLKTKMQVYDIFQAMALGHSFTSGEILELSDASIEYISRLGLYLMNVADYADTMHVHKKELERLKKEERNLKEKLGIE